MSKSYLIKGKPDGAYAVMTLKCNSRCKHCYLEASPDRTESMSMALRKKVVDEVAKNGIKELIISGGELTTEMEKLADTIEYASESKRKTGYPRYLVLQTNAYFLEGLDEKQIERELEGLKSKGVTNLDVTSDDSYHKMGKKELEKIRKVGEKVFDGRIEVRGAGKRVVPIGRAREEVPKKNWEKYGCSLNDDKPWWRVDISVDGGVYPCCWQATPPMGDLSEEPLSKILERARGKDGVFRKLAGKGFSSLSPEELGLEIGKEELDKMIGGEGDCATCYQLYLPLKKKGSSKNDKNQ